MLWLILSLFTALAVSSHDAWVKKFFSDLNPFEMAAYPIKGLIAGCLFYLHALFRGYAISLVKAAYMISIKRLSIPISVFYGGLIFKESNIIMRFLRAALMLSGAVIIIIKG